LCVKKDSMTVGRRILYVSSLIYCRIRPEGHYDAERDLLAIAKFCVRYMYTGNLMI